MLQSKAARIALRVALAATRDVDGDDKRTRALYRDINKVITYKGWFVGVRARCCRRRQRRSRPTRVGDRCGVPKA